MAYQPVIPATGNLGWSFLQRTRAAQQETYDTSSTVVRATDYFQDNIGKIQTAEDLVNDRRLLSVALGAFGLDDDISNKFFIRKVLEEGTLNEESFANRLADKRYFAMSEAFGFDLQPPNTVLSDFSDSILENYRTRQFEIAVGNQDENLRLALGIERDLAELDERGLSEKAAWFTVMGTPTMRQVFEEALGLPAELASVDLDQQLGVFQEKAMSRFGVSHPAEFSDPDLREKLIRNFLVQSQLTSSSSTSRGSVALSLLQSQAPLF